MKLSRKCTVSCRIESPYRDPTFIFNIIHYDDGDGDDDDDDDVG